MIKIKSRSEYQTMPWKNGKGTTEQIAVDEGGGWRISAATVRMEGPFSEYKSRHRLLCVWKGEGLQLNEKFLRPGEIMSFSGDTAIHCRNLSAEVIDLGVIYDPRRFQIQMSFESADSLAGQELLAHKNFLFCAQGQFLVESNLIEEGSTLEVQDQIAIQISEVSEDLKLIWIQIFNSQ